LQWDVQASVEVFERSTLVFTCLKVKAGAEEESAGVRAAQQQIN
jgi:hypothetical protein